jgi:hypothetical protein
MVKYVILMVIYHHLMTCFESVIKYWIMLKISVELSPTSHLPSDRELIERIAKKDLNAHRQIICKYYEFIFLEAYGLFQCDDKANEYVTSLMLYIWDNGHCIARDCDLKDYLLGLIHMNYKRDKKNLAPS